MINGQSEMFTYQNSRCSSEGDLTITYNNVIADVHVWEVCKEGNSSEHNYLKYKIGKANNHKNEHNSQGIRYVVNEEKYYEFERNLEQDIKKFSRI